MWLKLIGGVVVLGIAALSLKMLTGWAYDAGRLDERIVWSEASRDADKVAADARVADVQRQADAMVALASTWERQEPVILRSKETVREYAKTDAGAVRCLDAGRVRGIETTAIELGLRPASGSGTDAATIARRALPVDAVGNAAGQVNDGGAK